MKVYSQSLSLFVENIKNIIRNILITEVGVKVGRSRFYDYEGRYSYPLSVVIFDKKSVLGYFAPDFYELGFHRNLLYAGKELLYSVIRHELAHYFVFIMQGKDVPSHGEAFHSFCKKLGWGEEVSRASVCLSEGDNAIFQEKSSVLRKVQKLLMLATSSNQYEAEQAFLKSRELLLLHNMQALQPSVAGEDPEFVCKAILPEKRDSVKKIAIARIIQTFFVNVVQSRTKESVYIEISGSEENVEVAEYVAHVLDYKLDDLWKQAQKENPLLKGVVSKNSFFSGVARGYCDRVQALRKDHMEAHTRELLVLEKQLEQARLLIYPKLSQKTSTRSFCKTSWELGQKAGENLQIQPAIQSSNKNLLLSKK